MISNIADIESFFPDFDKNSFITNEKINIITKLLFELYNHELNTKKNFNKLMYQMRKKFKISII